MKKRTNRLSVQNYNRKSSADIGTNKNKPVVAVLTLSLTQPGLTAIAESFYAGVERARNAGRREDEEMFSGFINHLYEAANLEPLKN